MSGKLLDKDPFSRIIGIILLCSSIAAIMSTMDSAVLAASNVITIDFFANKIGKVIMHLNLYTGDDWQWKLNYFSAL